MHHYRHKPYELEKLWIVTAISNPARYNSRYRLYHQFKKMCEKSGAQLFTIEVAFGSRPFEVTSSNDPNNLQLRTNDEIWHKENMLNLAMQRLPADWQYVAWIDADISFMRDDWVEEIVHQLQHYKIVQLFQTALDLGPMGEVIAKYDGFISSWMTGKTLPVYSIRNKYGFWHPGFAWAARREAINDLGGLIDTPILGSADNHMAFALIGKALDYIPTGITASYREDIAIWQDRATRHIRQNIGFMPGTIFHHFHGKKRDRQYNTRWQILIDWSYDPRWDIKRDSQGLYMLSDQGDRMRNDIRRYFHSRNEDSIDL